MITKSRILKIGIPILLLIIASIIDQSRDTTYAKFIDQHLEDGEEVLFIQISSYSLLQNKKFTTKIEHPKMIEQIITKPSIDLKRNFTSSDLSLTTYPNEVTIQGESTSFTFHFSESAIYKEKHYKINPAPDSLFHIINSQDLTWELEDEKQ